MKKFGLSAFERIKSRKDFENLFTSGKVVYSFDKKFKARFIVEYNSSYPGVKIAAAVHKKSGIAVWRNRVKRLIKESYRLNKGLIKEICLEKKILLLIVFSPNQLNERKNKKIAYSDIFPGILDVITKVKSSL